MPVQILILLFLGEKIAFDSPESSHLDAWIHSNYPLCTSENKRHTFICHSGYWISLKPTIHIAYLIRLNQFITVLGSLKDGCYHSVYNRTRDGIF